MSTSTLKEQRKEKVLEWTRRPQQMPRDVIGRLISHHQLRCFEKGFPNPVYFKGVFRSSLGEIYKLRVCTPRGWDQFRDHVRDERTMSNEDIYGEGYHTYLKLEDVLQEGRLYRATSSLRTDWENETLHEDVTSNPDRPYAVHHRSHVTGVFYDPPHRHAVGGTYVLHCGSASSFNHNLSDGPNFILKVGHSKDILRRLHEHQRTSSNLRTHGEVVFLFGVETDKCDRVPAESLLKVMMTEFVFSRVTVYNNVLNLKVSEGTHAVEWSALAHLVLMVEQSKTREQQDVHGKIGIEEETLWENPL
ncbi:hypothetical protein P3T76_008775 [Phytophthora citrophthora]|uniref:Uncharacterized protein n=1 Tax=Phytophthora citrophthora TaxID=4793 RepID=A0AAD9GJN9_9STRA|nr:hypothetical protein P3T76_008775 [Phytophthora citrophthora]